LGSLFKGRRRRAQPLREARKGARPRKTQHLSIAENGGFRQAAKRSLSIEVDRGDFSRRRLILSCMIPFVVILAATALPMTYGLGQDNTADPSTKQPSLTVVKLPPATYPPIALAAGVSGSVDLKIKLGAGGKLASEEAVDGPPMLRQPAMELAEQTVFSCTGCTPDANEFQVTYRFELGPAILCSQPDSAYPRVTLQSNQVVIAAQPWGICDPAGTVERTRRRSAKCLYLWNCTWR